MNPITKYFNSLTKEQFLALPIELRKKYEEVKSVGDQIRKIDGTYIAE